METMMRIDPANPVGDFIRAPALPPAILESGSPEIDSLPYFKDQANAISTGIWKASAFTAISRPYGTHEFMLLLEGGLSLISPDGEEAQFSAPDAFVVPKGSVVQWKQSGNIRKIYMILAGESLPSTMMKPIKIDSSAALEALPIGADGVKRASKLAYADPSEQLRVGQWESSAFKAPPTKAMKHELMHIIEGELILTGLDGVAQSFTTGETVFLPLGSTVSWECPTHIRKIFCTFLPA